MIVSILKLNLMPISETNLNEYNNGATQIDMEGISTHNNQFTPNDVKNNNYEANNTTCNSPSDLAKSLKSVLHTIERLEQSFRKSNKYEMRLLQCKHGHSHSHDSWFGSESSKDHKYTSTYSSSNCQDGCNKKSAEACVDKTESMSTLSIVCLQYKYEEVLKHYEALFQAYDKRCHEVSLRDSKLLRCRQRMVATHAQIAHAHNTLLTVGEKYLVLKKKSNIQRKRHKEQLNRMRQILYEVVAAAEEARLLFDARLSRFLANKKDSDLRLLIQEIRKYNQQILENIPLKELLAEYMRGSVNLSNINNDFEYRK